VCDVYLTYAVRPVNYRQATTAERRCISAAPSDETWAIEDLDKWRVSYEQELEAIGAEQIVAWLTEVAGKRPSVLLCWEKVPEKPCHRRCLAE
jgi:hypothetical protein